MYLDFSEMQPIFETCLKDNGNLSRIQIFEIISSYGLIIHSFVWGFYILFVHNHLFISNFQNTFQDSFLEACG